MALTVFLDILHVAIIEGGEIGPGFTVGTKELIELGVEGLGVAVLGSVDEQRHQPRG